MHQILGKLHTYSYSFLQNFETSKKNLRFGLGISMIHKNPDGMAGYSTTPLVKKLGIKENMKVKFINPPSDFANLLGDLPLLATNPFEVKNEEIEVVYDFILMFTNQLEDLERQIPLLKQQLDKKGMIWVSWYKKSAKMPTEITEDLIRDTALAIGLVDVKVCAIDNKWSGLKLVFRLKDR